MSVDTDDIMKAVMLGLSPATCTQPDFIATGVVSECLITSSYCELRQYKDRKAARQAFHTMPVSLRLGTAGLEAARWGVQGEVAWVLMLLEAAACKQKLDIKAAIGALWQSAPKDEEKLHFHPRKLASVRKLHR